MGNVGALLHGSLPLCDDTTVGELPQELQNVFEGFNITYLKDMVI